MLTFMEEASPKLIQEYLIQCMGGILNTLRHTGAHRDSEGPQCLLGSLVSQCNPSEPAQAFFSFPSPPSGALGRIPPCGKTRSFALMWICEQKWKDASENYRILFPH